MYTKDLEWHTKFVGQRQQHNYWLYEVLGRVIEKNPQIKSIVEIGTGNGALTLVLGLWACRLNLILLTLDINPSQAEPISKVLDKLSVKRITLDEFSPVAIDSIRKHIGQEPCLMICDGGNKPRELNLWASMLPKGSIITGHDWTVEIQESDVKDMEERLCEPIHKEWWLEKNIQMAFWKVK